MFQPSPRRGACGVLGSYVATGIYEGRPLFDVLQDEYVQLRRDDYPDVLNLLACDEVVRRAMSVR
jgi:hypothetical protein